MRTEHDPRLLEGRVAQDPDRSGDPLRSRPRHGGHGWMMIVCCIPMLLIAAILVATGAARPGFLVVAVGCTLMMALMMLGMGHGGHDRP